MIRRPPRSTLDRSSAASDVYKRQQYMDARPISEPIHLFDCVMPCAGAEAFLVLSEARARDLGLAHVLLRGAIERHNAFADDPVLLRGGWLVDRDDLYAQAGVRPEAVDFVQTYDDYPVSYTHLTLPTSDLV